jgi:para-aminobenzoate synthetase component 1
LQEKQKIIRLLKRSPGSNRQKINSLIIKKYKAKQIGNLKLASNFSQTDYIRAILKTREHIHDGDIYQANISQRFSCSIDVGPADLYYMLRQKNSAPFCAYLSFPGLKIGCSSPERFIFLKDRCVQTRPIKGTRPRGGNIKEDNKYIKELQESLKDHAELNMIVDLERNDLGRFCQYGTVKVKEHAVVEKYARVFHLVSTITGQLQEGYSHTDIIKAAFPGGSITGAPKIRAMEIIDSLEPTARNIYTGSIGYIGLDGTMDLNIAIRTFVIKNKKFYYNVGGGIVEDSIPESEYQETLDKGSALKETLEFFSQENLEVK